MATLFLIGLVLAICVYNDSKKHGNGIPLIWAILVFLFPLIEIFAYLLIHKISN